MVKRQPIGVFPGLAGFFLLPKVANMDYYISDLLKGYLPNELPEAWLFFSAAVSGESEQTVLSLTDNSKEGVYNRFILMPNEATFQDAKQALKNDESYMKLLHAVAWRLQLVDDTPNAEGLNGEIRAFILASLAYEALQNELWEKGLQLLNEAALSVTEHSPIFAARLFSERAATKQMIGYVDDDTIITFEKALQFIKHSPFTEMKAELSFQLGTAYQERAANGETTSYLKAIKCYNDAVQLYDKEKLPEEFAMTHMNLALAYLGMPTDPDRQQLRIATAIQSLREALRFFKKDTHRDYWASATINLANTLQYAKSSHIEDNLWEAVSLYAEVLEVRKEEDDPIGYARLIANQATALSHLGAFSRAVPQLHRAKVIFEREGEIEASDAIDDTLNEIKTKQRELLNESNS